MGNRWQEGGYLASQIQWANRHFKRGFIHMGDTLHRHNLLDRMTPEEARAASYVMGSAWLARNEHVLETFQIPFEIIRWDRWLDNPEFWTFHATLREYYNSNTFFRGIVARDVALFTARNAGVNPARCVDYLLEEAAADTLFCRQNPVARIYPASELATYAHLSRTNIPAPLKGLDRGVRVRVSFHRRKGGTSGAQKQTDSPDREESLSSMA